MNPFVGSQRVLEIINLSRYYACRPSVLMGLEEPYDAFCFDEACAFIGMKMENDEQPKFKVRYSSFKELYKNYS